MAITHQLNAATDPLDGFGDTSNAKSLKDVTFTRQQLAHLETVFPEPVTSGTTTDAQLRHTAGQRSVILYLKTRCS